MIKQYFYGIIGIFVLVILGYSHYKAYEAGENHIKEINHDQIQKAENEKQRIDSERKAAADLDRAGYLGALSVLNNRLRNIQALPRGTDLCVADKNGNQGTMPRTETDTAGILVPFKTRAGVASFDIYSDAMKDILQCQRLIDYLKK